MIEIEKKFILTPEQEKSLIEGAEFLGEKQFTDIYYDDNNFSLTKKDIWLRERDSKFELKLPMNESFEKRVADQYRELDVEDDILAHFGSRGVSVKEFLIEKNYKPFCKITTTRKKYKKDGFGIDLDIMDFGYTLAEIELMVDNELNMKEATNSIINFASKCGIDTTVSILGKVMKYLQLNNPTHFQALIDEWKNN
ncbi:CYTH domain-containing protein [Candidatus Parcubacteria bacterium]|nr:CYTH domain-containing protein [Candidatus Parcubacteria bacterium]